MEYPEPSTQSDDQTQKERHVGLSANRLHPKAGNPREITFAAMWRKENQYGQLQQLIPNCTERDEQVAATIVQWLGSTVGMCFLRDVLIENPAIKDWLGVGVSRPARAADSVPDGNANQPVAPVTPNPSPSEQ